MQLGLVEPYIEMKSSIIEMNRLFDNCNNNNFFDDTLNEEWTYSEDCSETDKSLVIRAALPGFEAKDLCLIVSGATLTIKGEKKNEYKMKDEHYHCDERSYCTFQRVFQLPSGVTVNKIRANIEDDVLNISLPREEEHFVRIDVAQEI